MKHIKSHGKMGAHQNAISPDTAVLSGDYNVPPAKRDEHGTQDSVQTNEASFQRPTALTPDPCRQLTQKMTPMTLVTLVEQNYKDQNNADLNGVTETYRRDEHENTMKGHE